VTGPLVLIVDDNAMNLKLARDVLCHAGFRTVEADSGEAGLALAEQHRPDVILMDIRLPDTEGTEVMQRLKAQSGTARVPVVALTSFAMKGDRDRFLALGFDGYLEKPISVKAFPGQVLAFCRTEGL
jgi:two-component system cell cycle response regulator DivK